MALALGGAGVAVALSLGPGVPARPIPRPSDMASLDPDVAQLIESALADMKGHRLDMQRWVRLGMCYQANDMPVQALQCYHAITVMQENDSRGWYGLALMHASLGKFEDAERAMRRAIELEPEYGPSHWRLGQWLFDQGRIKEAGDAFARATNLEKNDPAGWFGVARVRLAEGDAATAVTILEWLSHAPPPNGPYAWQLLAGAYRQLGRMDEARTAQLRGHGAAPLFRDPWQNEVDQLKRGFGALLNQAKALLAVGRAQESIALLQRLHERRPDDPMVLNNLATAYRAIGRTADSQRALQDALALQPGFVQAHFGLALLEWSETKDADASLQRLNMALELNSSYAPAHALKGEILASLGRHEEAAASFEQAYTLQPQQIAWLQQGARSLLVAEQWTEAADWLDTVTRQSPASAEAWRAYSVVLARLNRPHDAQHALDKARELAPESDRDILPAETQTQEVIEP